MNRIFHLFSSLSASKLIKLGCCAAAVTIGLTACGGGSGPDPSFFTQKGCVQCHSVSAFGLASAAQIGPDLSDAVDDVPRRFNKSLEEFMANPTGTMQLVLSSQIKLTDAEKAQAVALIKLASEKKKSGK
ncbi:MAG TPA: hypothetical protein VEF04_01930 [Blastocatellia bacterium]|nr:hypothetical protein [Blastocatellia bacterium]